MIYAAELLADTVDGADRIRVGVLGLEGTHAARGVVLNTAREDGYPRYRLTRISGLHALPERDDVSGSKFGQLGERDLPTLARGKTVVYEGVIQALTMTDLRLAEDALRWAFGDQRGEQVWTVRPHRANPHGLAMTYRAKTAALELDDEVTRDARAQPSPWLREFTLSVRQSDPRYFDVDEQEATDPASVVVANPGSAPTDPVIEVGGPVDAEWWGIAYGDGTRYLTLHNVAVGAEDTVTFDFGARQVRVGDTIVTGALTADSTWWDEGAYGIDPRSTDAVYLDSGGASITVRWHPAHF